MAYCVDLTACAGASPWCSWCGQFVNFDTTRRRAHSATPFSSNETICTTFTVLLLQLSTKALTTWIKSRAACQPVAPCSGAEISAKSTGSWHLLRQTLTNTVHGWLQSVGHRLMLPPRLAGFAANPVSVYSCCVCVSQVQVLPLLSCLAFAAETALAAPYLLL